MSKKPTTDEVILDIAETIFTTLSHTDIEAINKILANEDQDSQTAANEICEYLGIDKRHNRNAIAAVLTKYYI